MFAFKAYQGIIVPGLCHKAGIARRRVMVLGGLSSVPEGSDSTQPQTSLLVGGMHLLRPACMQDGRGVQKWCGT